MSFVSRYLEPELVERLNHLQLSARRVVEGSTIGLHKSPFKGASIEFRQHRIYTPGDELRRLDWRVLGRTDRPYIKEYDEETNLRCILALDVSGSMGYRGGGMAKIEYASRLVAALAYLMLANTEHVGLAIFGGQLQHWVPPRSGTGQLSQIVDTLERLTPRGESNHAKSMHQIADRLGRRSLVIMVSDCFSPAASIREGLAHFDHDRHEVMVMRVLDRQELEFPFRSWSRFKGLEGEKSQICEPAAMRKMYLNNFARHAEQVEQACRSMKMDYKQFLTDQVLADSLTQFLRR